MNENIPSYLRLEDNSVYYNGEGQFVFFIPEIFFERNHAIYEGDIIYTIGVLIACLKSRKTWLKK